METKIIEELDRRIYYSKDPLLLEGFVSNLLLLVKEKDAGWIPLSFDWEYSLWTTIGKRGGLVEAGELVFASAPDSNVIENYIKTYRDAIDTAVPRENILNEFDIELTVTFKSNTNDHKKITLFDKSRLEKYQGIINEYAFEKQYDGSYKKKLDLKSLILLDEIGAKEEDDEFYSIKVNYFESIKSIER